jgi:hypothetical protein
MTPALKTGLKIGGIILVLLIIIWILWYVFKGAASATWTPYVNKDFPYQGDIENKPSGTVAEDTAYAEKIGAKSFFRHTNGNTYYKSVSGVPTTAAVGTIYVKQ